MVVATHFVVCNSPKAGFDKHKGVSTMNFVGGFKVGGFTNSMYSFTLWYFHIAIANGPFIGDLPPIDGDFP